MVCFSSSFFIHLFLMLLDTSAFFFLLFLAVKAVFLPVFILPAPCCIVFQVLLSRSAFVPFFFSLCRCRCCFFVLNICLLFQLLYIYMLLCLAFFLPCSPLSFPAFSFMLIMRFYLGQYFILILPFCFSCIRGPFFWCDLCVCVCTCLYKYVTLHFSRADFFFFSP
jgi:hypothetical protein